MVTACVLQCLLSQDMGAGGEERHPAGGMAMALGELSPPSGMKAPLFVLRVSAPSPVVRVADARS